MPLENSPSLNNYSNGIPDDIPGPAEKKKSINFIIYTLFGVIVILGIFSILKRNNTIQLAGSGTISGYTVNQYDQPVPAEVFISGSDETIIADENGYFQLDRVPVGDYSLIVGYNFVGSEYPVNVSSKSNTEMGRLEVSAPHKPFEY